MLNGVSFQATEDSQHAITIVVSRPKWVPPERLELSDGLAVNYSRLPLDSETFEEKCVAVRGFLEFNQHAAITWTKVSPSGPTWLFLLNMILLQ
jgi:hypothetical protein